MHLYQVSSPMSLHKYLIYHQAYMAATLQMWPKQPLWYIEMHTQYFACVWQNTTNCNINFSCYCHAWDSKKMYLNMPHIQEKGHVHIWHTYVSIDTSYELSPINNMTRNTGIHTFHIIDTCFWTIMPTAIHIYVPLHYYCSLHTDGTHK